MTMHRNSQPTRPRYESAPYRQAPARREHIYGKVEPMRREPELDPIWIFMVIAALALIVVWKVLL